MGLLFLFKLHKIYSCPVAKFVVFLLNSYIVFDFWDSPGMGDEFFKTHKNFRTLNRQILQKSVLIFAWAHCAL